MEVILVFHCIDTNTSHQHVPRDLILGKRHIKHVLKDEDLKKKLPCSNRPIGLVGRSWDERFVVLAAIPKREGVTYCSLGYKTLIFQCCRQWGAGGAGGARYPRTWRFRK